MKEIDVGSGFRCDACRAHVDLEFQSMKRMRPGAHLLIDKGVAASDSDASEMNVVIDELRGIDIVERALNQIGGRLTKVQR